MEKKEVKVGKEDFLIINLNEDAQKLDEVVVTAFGITKEKRSLGFSTATVDAKEITDCGVVIAVLLMHARKGCWCNYFFRFRQSWFID